MDFRCVSRPARVVRDDHRDAAVRFPQLIGDDEDDPLGNVQHVAEHGLTVDDVAAVLNDPESEGFNKSSDRPCCFGYTPSGEYIIAIYEEINGGSAYPVTARVPLALPVQSNVSAASGQS